MVHSDKHKILTKNYISWRAIMRDRWGQNFRTKDGRQVALTGCWRSSDTRAQWTDVGAATDREVPARMKTLTRWTIWFWVQRTSQNSQHSTRNITEDRRKSSVVPIIRKDLQLKCFKRRRAQELSEANCTACKLLLKKFFFQFMAVCRGLSLLYRWEGVHCGCSIERIVTRAQQYLRWATVATIDMGLKEGYDVRLSRYLLKKFN